MEIVEPRPPRMPISDSHRHEYVVSRMRITRRVHDTHLMLTIAFRDLQWRLRRIIVAVLGASLVLALALVMSGLSAGFTNESARTVAIARSTGWVIDQDGTGPFLQPSPLATTVVDQVVGDVGAQHAAPMVFARQSVRTADGKAFGTHLHVNLVGVVPGRLGAPVDVRGQPLATDGDVIVDETLGASIGDRVLVGSATLTVSGLVSGARLLAGVPNVYVTIGVAQDLAFRGQPLATAVLVDRPVTPPPGTKVLDNAAARTDGLRPVVNAQKTIAMVRSLLWLVAALIVGSVMYLGALERTKDVAVLKGMGATSRSLGLSLAVQAALLAIGASIIGAALAFVIAPVFPLSAEIPPMAFAALPLLAVIVAMLASLAAARRIFSIQPALAFGN
jgi:putative ABC transport system permease protein